MRCDEVAEILAESAEDGMIHDRAARRHVERCLQCQAEVVQYRKLLRALHNLRTEVLEPAPGLVSDILAYVEAAGERHAIRSIVTGRRLAYVGGIAAATAAGAAGALLFARNGRRVRVAS
jgi:hypothetical protein